MFKDSAINDDPVVAWIDKVRNSFCFASAIHVVHQTFTPMMDTEIDDQQEIQQRV